MFLDIPGRDSRQIVESWFARVFFAAWWHFCSVFRYSWEGFETNRGLRVCFLLPGGNFAVSLDIPGGDSRQMVVCAVFFVA